MRLIFAGTPRTAVPSLEALLASRHEVAAVLTRPDAPAGRGQRPSPSPVALRAAEAGLTILRPASVREPGFLDTLTELAPDCCPVTAYGALIPQAALDVPPHGWVNLHFSLLPAWRGAAPVPHAILHGDTITGATTFHLVKELDAGPVYGVVTEAVRDDDTTGGLLARLAETGAELLVKTLDGIEAGQLRPQPQPADGISLAPKLTTEDAHVRWDTPVLAVSRQIRACTPAPGAWTTLAGTRLKLWPPAREVWPAGAVPTGMAPAGDDAPPGYDLKPGQLHATRAGVWVGTATAPVQLTDVQPAGKRQMSALEWARGLRLNERDASQQELVFG